MVLSCGGAQHATPAATLSGLAHMVAWTPFEAAPARSCFEFEKVRKAYWSHADPAERRTLRTLLGWLLPLGYQCFWQADKYLVPASGACWNDAFEDMGWSNLVCAHQPQVLRFFGEQFNTTREQLVEHWQKLAAKMKIKAPAHSTLRASIAKATTSKVRSARLGFI